MRRPLTIEEYELELRQSVSDLELVERVFRDGLASNRLRSVLWPYLFGLVKKRGRFMHIASNTTNSTSTTSNNTCNGFQNSKTVQKQTFERQTCVNGSARGESFVYIEHEENLKRWRVLKKLYKTYESQWKSIQPDQELRFSSFRERKSLIERDVVRSDRTHPFYSGTNSQYNCSENLEKLANVLMTYMMYDFDIGYLQGMSDLAAPILYVFQGNVVKTFWVFVEVMKLLRRNFEFSQKTIHFQLNCLFRLIKLTDPKLAHYLRENDCSNCFFLFRHIVCQFKRELMRATANSADSTPVESSRSTDDGDDNDLVSNGSLVRGDKSCRQMGVTNGEMGCSNGVFRDDYANVLNLWDTIWFVQKRHELRAKSKCVHSFKVAPTNDRLIPKEGSTASSPQESTVESSTSSTSSASSTSSTCLYSCRTRSANAKNGTEHKKVAPKVRQEQVVYTKETFYSSFDPNQADIPRFDLTETEKFVISLCMSLISRERNYILKHRLDASDIHQHFINPRLACDLDRFIGQAYEIYHYLNNECDLQTLIREASEFGPRSDYSPIDKQILVQSNNNGGQLRKNPSNLSASHGIQMDLASSTATSDSFDLLKDYFIISPTAYNVSMNSLNPHSLDQNDESPPNSYNAGHLAHLGAIRRARVSSTSVPGAANALSVRSTPRSWNRHFIGSTAGSTIA